MYNIIKNIYKLTIMLFISMEVLFVQKKFIMHSKGYCIIKYEIAFAQS